MICPHRFCKGSLQFVLEEGKSRGQPRSLWCILPPVPGGQIQGHGASLASLPRSSLLFPSCKTDEGVNAKCHSAKCCGGCFSFPGWPGVVSVLQGQRKQLQRPPVQPLKMKSSSCLPLAWGPRSPHGFTTPASRPGGFLCAALPHWGSAHRGRVWGMVGRCGPPGRRHLGDR